MRRDDRRDARLLRVLVAFGGFAVVEYGAWIAVLFYAYDAGGVSLAGAVGVVQLVVAAVLAPALGSLGDRLPRGAALCGSYAAEAVFLGLTAALLVAGAPVAAVVAASALATTTISIARPIHYAALPQLARTPGALVRANSVSAVLDGVGLFVGPVVAGVLAERASPAVALGLSAVVMLLAAALTARLRLPVAAEPDGEGALRSAVAGLRHVGTDHGVLALLLLLGAAFLVSGAIEVLAVAFTDVELGAGDAAAGLLFGASGLGVLIGASLAVLLAFRARLAVPVLLAVVVAGLPLVLMAQVSTLGPAVVLVAIYGAGQAVAGVAGRTLLQRGTDDRVLARVFAVQEGVTLIGLALGAALAPLLVAWLGPAAGFVPLGAGLVIAALLCWVPMRALDARAVLRPDVVALLRRVEFLAAMPPPSIERLARSAVWIDVAPGEVVVAQGDVGDAFYVVDQGSLTVEVDGVRRDRQLGAGDGFGEVALLGAGQRTATVAASTEVRLLRVERDAFLAAITGSPDGRRIAGDVASAHLARDAGRRP